MTGKRSHPCAKCGARIKLQWKYCRRCAGIKPRSGDALQRRLPGGYGTGKGR